MSSLAVHFYIPQEIDLGDCAVCLDPLSNGQPLAVHAGEGYKHPFHARCLKDILKCPLCRVPIDTHALVSWKDRVYELCPGMTSMAGNGIIFVVGMIIRGYIDGLYNE